MEQDPFFTSFFCESGKAQLPSADFSELNDRYRLEMDVPGFTEKDLEIELRDNTLILHGKKEEQNQEKNKTYLVRERRSSSWIRSFALPENAKLDQIECAVKEGKLTIEIPKSEVSKGKKLKINWK